MAHDDTLRCARLAARSLAEAVETSFGPQPREKLLVSAVGRVLITSSGASILRSLVTEPAESPVARYLIDCALGHADSAGEGATAFILMADAALCSIDALLAPLPPSRRRAEQSRLAHELAVLGGHTLPAVLEPDWRLACLAVPLRSLDPPAAALLLRQVGLAIAATSLGAAFSAPASAAVCSALVGALLPEEGEGEAGQQSGAAGGRAASAGDRSNAHGVWRLAQARAGGGVAVVGAPGEAVNRSTSLRGLLLRARRIDETGMPQSGHAAGVLFLGPRALPPDAAGAQPPTSRHSATLRVPSAAPAAHSHPPSRPSDNAGGGAGLHLGVGVRAGAKVRARTGMGAAVSADEGDGVGDDVEVSEGVGADADMGLRPVVAPAHPAQPSPYPLTSPDGFSPPFGLADASDWATARHEEWVGVAGAAGVGLILSCARLSPHLAQLCSAFGIAAAEGVELASLAPLLSATRVLPLRRWPRPSELRQLLNTNQAPHLLRGCEFCFERAGGQAWVRLVPPRADAPALRTALLRAPTEGLVREYVRAAHCAMRTLRVWLCEAGRENRGVTAGGVGTGRDRESGGRGGGEGGEARGGEISGGARGVGLGDGTARPRPGGEGEGWLPAGARVIVAGLTGAPKYNGMRGYVVGWEAARGRYAVRVAVGAGGAGGGGDRGADDGACSDNAPSDGTGGADARNRCERGAGGRHSMGAADGVRHGGDRGGECHSGESRPRTGQREGEDSAGGCACDSTGRRACESGGGGKTLLLKPSNLTLLPLTAGAPGPSTESLHAHRHGAPPHSPQREGLPVTHAAPAAGGTGRAACGGAAADEPPPWMCYSELLCVAGGGAAELKLEALVRRLLRPASPRVSLMGRGEGGLGARCGPLTDSDGVQTPVGALRVLSAALLAIPRQLHANAGSCAATCPSTPGGGGAGSDRRGVRDGRWLRVLQVLQQAHDESPGCRLGIVVQTDTPKAGWAQPVGGGGGGGTGGKSCGAASCGGTCGGMAPCTQHRNPLVSPPWPVQYQRIGDAADALVLHPYTAKLQAVQALLSCLSQLLRIDGIVPAVRLRRGRRGAAAGRAGSVRRRRRVGSAFESSSDSSEGDGGRSPRGESDSSASEEG
jgi:hypothetical protein